MNKTWIRGLTGLTILTGAVACNTSDITTANRNPNSPTTAPAGALFTSAVAASVRRWVGFGGAAIITQQLANTTYPTADSYISLQADGTSGTFNSAYTNDLPDLRQVVAKGRAAGQPGIYGPAMVMQTWDYSYLTDQWGDVPYSEAAKADSGIVTPKYDAQKDIYTGFFTTLKSAADAMAGAAAGSPGLGNSDPIYNGDLTKWRRFDNSLHARYAMRVVNVDPATADAELKVAFSDPGGVLQSNADNAKLTWPGDGVSDNPFADNLKQRDDARLARTMTSLMTNDPRIKVYGQPVVDSSAYPAGYGGMPAALTQDSANAWYRKASRPGVIFYPGVTSYGTFGTSAGLSQPSYLMTYAEVLFIRAEAAERSIGGVPHGEAAADYYAAIRASMAQWGVTDAAAINAFISGPTITYQGGTAGLKQIAIQKWIALYSDDVQAWAEWRRTCQPAGVVPGPNTIVPYIPRRYYYSTTEASVNAANLNAAIARQGPDNFATRMYWDTKPTNAPTCQ
jgi:SusD/RagB-like outer membrane lipoprotein